MKKTGIIILFLAIVSSCVTENINTVLSTHELHEIRLRRLKDFCAKVNEEIAALQIIVNAGWSNADYITNLEKTQDGYIITFAQKGIVKITDGMKGDPGSDGTNGTDGENGNNGTDGTDGLDGLNAPVISVRKHSDGRYYWTSTLNDTTSWLSGEAGEMLPVGGQDGDNGQDGSDGKPGSNGVLPTLSVDNEGFWLINGVQLLHNGHPVRAAGAQGPQGNPGQDGEIIGNSGGLLIKKVDNYPDSAVFILAQTNEKFIIPKFRLPEFRFDDDSPTVFYFGQTLSFPYTCSHPENIIFIVPKGWYAENNKTKKKVIVSSLEQNDTYGEISGKITTIVTNKTGQSITSSISVSAIKAFKVEKTEFTDSRVYHILSPEGSKIGELCTEYIPGFSEDMQAQVVYPYNAREKKYGRGFVLNGGGYVDHDGLKYTGKTGISRDIVYITVDGVIPDAPAISTPTTHTPDLLSDIDGNQYPITKIGKQYWITKNWNTTHYTDGTPITIPINGTDWNSRSQAKEPLGSYPKFNPALQKSYGLIYNYYAIETGKLFPEGWHIPTNDYISGDNELQEMIDFLGNDSGIKSRSTQWGPDQANGDWIPANSSRAGNNLSGFNAFPAGYTISTEHRSFGEFCICWTSSYEWRNNKYTTNHNMIDIRNYMNDHAQALQLVNQWGASIRLIRND